jgi:uncharacterized membrane protein YkvA (DUF1232 family)
MKTPWFFFRFLRLARSLLADGRLSEFLLDVARKRERKGRWLAGIQEELRLLQMLCLAWWRGEYRQISQQALLAAVAGLLYFLSPLDVIPDWLLGLGFLDDIAVLAWVARSWRGELEAFRAWLAAQSPQRQVELERLPAASRPEGR